MKVRWINLNYSYGRAETDEQRIDRLISGHVHSQLSHINHRFSVARGAFWESVKQLSADSLDNEFYVDRFKVVIGRDDRENVIIYDDGTVDIQDIKLSKFDCALIYKISELLLIMRQAPETKARRNQHIAKKVGVY